MKEVVVYPRWDAMGFKTLGLAVRTDSQAQWSLIKLRR